MVGEEAGGRGPGEAGGEERWRRRGAPPDGHQEPDELGQAEPREEAALGLGDERIEAGLREGEAAREGPQLGERGSGVCVAGGAQGQVPEEGREEGGGEAGEERRAGGRGGLEEAGDGEEGFPAELYVGSLRGEAVAAAKPRLERQVELSPRAAYRGEGEIEVWREFGRI